MKRVKSTVSYPAPNVLMGNSGSVPGWQLYRGMGGRLRLESVATLVWNTQLEDETGSINILVWKKTAIAQMDILVKARLLMVYGELDKDEEGRVAHVLAHRLTDLTPHLEELESRSRDFH
ncbi:protein containing OB-fold nucleic acid binding domain [Hahella chejuensis KCTC 2396]|uniref:Protein containing OB-fold nucleic acid binding domain n=1 Tax=Hahella chejuensis (strain KCTC 2396) TaxID=349521 RepID=Q2S8Z1_HAHCH|nr:nucleic acid-binding protein [Hahella chejuensis]ABC32883.1 protein containing OB-fold nucleic acid binding domain [Hahella chejuensis KCTC 2396]